MSLRAPGLLVVATPVPPSTVPPLNVQMTFGFPDPAGFVHAVGKAPAALDLSAQAADGVAPYVFEWDFGDGTKGSGAAVSHTYRATGTYRVTVAVTDARGTRTSLDGSLVVVA